MSGLVQYLFNEAANWKLAEDAAADVLRRAGWAVEQGVKVIVHGLPGELNLVGIADFIATKNGEVLIGEVKDGLSAKLSNFQKALLTNQHALGRLEIVSAERAVLLGLEAGTPLAAQLTMGSRIMYTLTGELGGRAASQWAARNSGALATRVVFAGVKAALGLPFFLLTLTN